MGDSRLAIDVHGMPEPREPALIYKKRRSQGVNQCSLVVGGPLC